MDSANIGEETIKCVVVGDGSVGKTSFLFRALTRNYQDSVNPTIFDNYKATVKVDEDRFVNLDIHDTSGQEEYDCLRSLVYPKTDIILICFAINSPASFENVKLRWIPEVEKFCPATPFVLVGTKWDLREDEETVEKLLAIKKAPISNGQGRDLAKEIKALAYVECSSKTFYNVKKVLGYAARRGVWDQSFPEVVRRSLKTITEMSLRIQGRLEDGSTTPS